MKNLLRLASKSMLLIATISLLLIFPSCSALKITPNYSAPVIKGQLKATPCEESIVIDEYDIFIGKDRAGCKTSLADGAYETFKTLDKLYKTLPDDEDMRTLGIRKDSHKRFEEEDRKVFVLRAYLYAYKFMKSGDHDYHLLIGTKGGKILLTAECSGLPAQAHKDYQTLLAARKQFRCCIIQKPGKTNRSWKFYDHPVPIEISGSLFYDIDHAPGTVGPKGLRPETSWEIHPISKFKFLK